jgi:hypothetical protein
MHANALPFDSDAMLAGLRTWVACESQTFDAGAVNRMMHTLDEHIQIDSLAYRGKLMAGLLLALT